MVFEVSEDSENVMNTQGLSYVSDLSNRAGKTHEGFLPLPVAVNILNAKLMPCFRVQGNLDVDMKTFRSSMYLSLLPEKRYLPQQKPQ